MLEGLCPSLFRARRGYILRTLYYVPFCRRQYMPKGPLAGEPKGSEARLPFGDAGAERPPKGRKALWASQYITYITVPPKGRKAQRASRFVFPEGEPLCGKRKSKAAPYGGLLIHSEPFGPPLTARALWAYIAAQNSETARQRGPFGFRPFGGTEKCPRCSSSLFPFGAFRQKSYICPEGVPKGDGEPFGHI